MNPHVLTCKLNKNVLIYDEIRSCRCGSRNTHISFFRHFFFFNVALQHLGPIDENYVLFIGFFDFWISTPWDLFDLSCSFCQFILWNRLFFNFEFSDFFFQIPWVFMAFLNWHFKTTFFGEKEWFLQIFNFCLSDT